MRGQPAISDDNLLHAAISLYYFMARIGQLIKSIDCVQRPVINGGPARCLAGGLSPCQPLPD